MKYLIFSPSAERAFFTNWFDVKNSYIEGDVIFNFHTQEFTMDCIVWRPITEDTL
jgi:hypothetical protein